MGFEKHWLMIFVIWLRPLAGASESYSNSRDSLDSSIYDYALKKLPGPRTGRFYNVSLSKKFSGMEVSVVRLRARGLWRNGVHYASIEIPPLVLPRPFVRRVDLVYKNLGNWSSVYYNVPNHTLVAPVIGFLAYDPNRSSTSYGLIELEIMGNNSFVVNFPNASVLGEWNAGAKCVRFDRKGTMEFGSMSGGRSCVARRQGHFSVVVPYETTGEADSKWRWVGIGVVAGILGLVVLLVALYRWIKGRRIQEMERESQGNARLGTIWIGQSRMPTALAIRTEPVLENSSVP